MYESLTRYAGELAENPGEWQKVDKDDGVVHLPLFVLSDTMKSFEQAFYDGGFVRPDYLEIVANTGIDFSRCDPEKVEVMNQPPKVLLAILTFAIRSERFSEGSLERFAKSGLMDNCLDMLKDWDEDSKLPQAIKDAVKQVLDRLEAAPEGTAISPVLCLEEVDGPWPADEGSPDTLFSYTYSLFLHAPKHGLELDMSAHAGMAEGLPWNLDFVVRHTGSERQPLQHRGDEGAPTQS